jgi:hypothetical protein
MNTKAKADIRRKLKELIHEFVHQLIHLSKG